MAPTIGGPGRRASSSRQAQRHRPEEMDGGEVGSGSIRTPTAAIPN